MEVEIDEEGDLIQKHDWTSPEAPETLELLRSMDVLCEACLGGQTAAVEHALVSWT